MIAGSERQCVVLGGCGFLGSVVTRHLLAEGALTIDREVAAQERGARPAA